MGQLIHIAYASAAVTPFTDAALRELLLRTREKNSSCGVTGILLHVERSFFQILEGEADTLEALFATVACDRRHTAIVKLIQEPIERREFADWSMGLARITMKELAAGPGLNDFFGGGSNLNELREGTARKILSAFAEGRWRSRVR